MQMINRLCYLKQIESKILVETDGPVRFSRCFEMKSGQISFIPSVIFCASKILGKTFDDMSLLLRKKYKFISWNIGIKYPNSLIEQWIG